MLIDERPESLLETKHHADHPPIPEKRGTSFTQDPGTHQLLTGVRQD